MTLSQTIAAVHESMEGRYNLNGTDLFYIYDFLCQLQGYEKESLVPKPIWLTADFIREVKQVYDSHIMDSDDHMRTKAVKMMLTEAAAIGEPIILRKAIYLLNKFVLCK
jgi:hypothetical protein